MNHDEHPDDGVLTRDLRDSLAELAVPGRPPLAAITGRGRARRRRRRRRLAGLGGVGAAVCAALAVGLAGVLGAAPARTTGTVQAAAPARGAVTITTAAFTLTRNANGTDTLTLTHSQMFDPVALQQALTRHGIPALVKTGIYCSSTPAPPDPVGAGVLSVRPPGNPVHPATRVPSGQQPSDPSLIADHTEMVINPAAMPSGTELFFGYSGSARGLFSDLIYASSYTCGSGQPPATP